LAAAPPHGGFDGKLNDAAAQYYAPHRRLALKLPESQSHFGFIVAAVAI
jgi:hypothetical protein